MKVIKVVLVGMNNLFLQGLRHLLDPAQFSIAAEASDLASWSVLVGEGLAPDSIPDLLLADLNGCSENDLDHLQSVRWRASWPTTPGRRPPTAPRSGHKST